MNYEAFCRMFTDKIPEATPQGERWYLMTKDVRAFTSGEQRKPHAQGLSLGMGRNDFVPSLALLRILAETSNNKAVVTDAKAEWLFVCGRDVFSEYFTTKISEGFVLVQNAHDENLGLGKLMQDKRGGPLLKNILDRGNYLRHDPVSLQGKKARKKSVYVKR